MDGGDHILLPHNDMPCKGHAYRVLSMVVMVPSILGSIKAWWCDTAARGISRAGSLLVVTEGCWVSASREAHPGGICA